jgi:gliding motility-associated-like protein
MTHEWGSDRFLAYLVTEQGVSEQPIISHSGSEHEYLTQNRIGYSNTIGEMKFSPNGKKLALAVQGQNLAQVFDFDATSGIVSNPVTLSEGFSDDPMLKPYGISFSANSKLLYVGASESRKIYQFEMEAGSTQTICESRYGIDVEKLPFYSVSGLQLAINGKIYVNQKNENATYAGVIHDPDKSGSACRFSSQEINPGNARGFYTWACFPNFISSYFDADPYITYQKACENTLYNFTIQNNLAVTTVEWQFGDTITSETINQSNELAPVHQFSKPGIYSVHARVSLIDGSMQELEKKIIVSPAFSLGNDTLLCKGDSLLLNASSQQGVYRWQDGSAKSTFTVKKSGIYWVDICTNGCSTRYTIEVTYEDLLDVDLGADQIICDDKPVLLSAHTKFASLYTWQDGSTNANFMASESGIYYVTVNSRCFQASDTISLFYQKAPVLELDENLSLCAGDTAYLDAYSTYAHSYRWFNLASPSLISTQSSLAITQEGVYVVEASNEGCTVRDTIKVKFDECDKNLFIPNVITPNGDGINDNFTVKGILEGKWTISIYNRQGRIVYQSQTYSNDWNGENLPYSNLYFYHLYNPSSKRSYKGWLQVLR